MRKEITVNYCWEWGYQLGAARVAAEVLSLHQAKIAALHLVPVTGGRFEVMVGGDVVYDKKVTKRLPQDGEVEAAVGKHLA